MILNYRATNSARAQNYTKSRNFVSSSDIVSQKPPPCVDGIRNCIGHEPNPASKVRDGVKLQSHTMIEVRNDVKIYASLSNFFHAKVRNDGKPHNYVAQHVLTLNYRAVYWKLERVLNYTSHLFSPRPLIYQQEEAAVYYQSAKNVN